MQPAMQEEECLRLWPIQMQRRYITIYHGRSAECAAAGPRNPAWWTHNCLPSPPELPLTRVNLSFPVRPRALEDKARQLLDNYPVRVLCTVSATGPIPMFRPLPSSWRTLDVAWMEDPCPHQGPGRPIFREPHVPPPAQQRGPASGRRAADAAIFIRLSLSRGSWLRVCSPRHPPDKYTPGHFAPSHLALPPRSPTLSLFNSE